MEDRLGPQRIKSRAKLLAPAAVLMLLLWAVIWFPGSAAGSQSSGENEPIAAIAQQDSLLNTWAFSSLALEGEEPFPPPDAACRQCHSDSDREIEFASGEVLAVQVEQFRSCAP